MNIADLKAYLESARDRAEADMKRCRRVCTKQDLVDLYLGRLDAFQEILGRLED